MLAHYYTPTNAPNVYPPAGMRKYRKKWHDAGYQPAGYWLECYSPTMGRWNTIKYLGDKV